MSSTPTIPAAQTTGTCEGQRSVYGIDTVVVGWGYGHADFDGPAAVKALAHACSIDDLREVLSV